MFSLILTALVGIIEPLLKSRVSMRGYIQIYKKGVRGSRVYYSGFRVTGLDRAGRLDKANVSGFGVVGFHVLGSGLFSGLFCSM